MSDQESDSVVRMPLPEVTIELVAGRHPNGEWVFERVLVSRKPEPNTYQLLKSPVFVRGLARGDVIRQLEQPSGAFVVVEHGGNLCVRVFSKSSFEDDNTLAATRQTLLAEMEKLGGDIDVSEPHVLVFSIHVASGFAPIEALLDKQLAPLDDVNWMYGNVYDPETGEPLDWWQPILNPG